MTELAPVIPIFNKYYSDLLKNLKNTCKQIRDSDTESTDKKRPAAVILKAIKSHYATFDHLSTSYFDDFIVNTADFYTRYLEGGNEFLKSGPEGVTFFKDVPLSIVCAILPEVFLVNYVATFGILVHAHKEGFSQEKVNETMEYIRKAQKLTPEDETIASATGGTAAPSDTVLKFVSLMNDETLDAPFLSEFKEIENTSIGKLAKEIVEDLKGDGGIPPLDLLSEGSSDVFAKLFSTVGGKIQNKLSSGELNQQSLMNDVMQLATKLPQMLPAGGLGGMEQMLGGNMTDMIANFQRMMSGSGPQARNLRASQKLKKKLRERK